MIYYDKKVIYYDIIENYDIIVAQGSRGEGQRWETNYKDSETQSVSFAAT